LTFLGQRGRINIVDAAIIAFVIILLPVGYATARLFRAPQPRIASVTRVEINREERRVAGGSRLFAKLKVRGSGFRPMLRASVDGTPTLGFVFEDPNTADVLVGEAAAGTHDLILFDGVQEVARAPHAVTIEARPAPHVRAVGAFVDLSKEAADALTVGATFPAGPEPQGEIVKLGEARPARRRVITAGTIADLAIPGSWERGAVVVLRCDPDPDGAGCAVGGQPLASPTAPTVMISTGAAPLSLSLETVLPTADARMVDVRVRFSAPPELLSQVRVGDRDAFLDDRAARVAEARGANVQLRLGADESRDGLRYRGNPITPGSTIRLQTDRYAIDGVVVSVK